ncbi:MAG: hypothetical protein NVS2B16_04310 [Chloroflexota bacterium]
MLSLLALSAVSGAVALWRRREMRAYVRGQWRRMLWGEVVFLAGFALFVVLRMWYPDLGHQFSPVSPSNLGQGRMGEKQMELGFLNAIVRSRVFPPFDPFFAHGYINYYYYGFFLVGSLCKLTQIIPATGFNLAIATFFGLLVGNVFSVVLTMTKRGLPALLGAVFVGIIGNLNGGWQLLRGLLGAATVHSSFPIFGGVADAVSGAWQVVVLRQPLQPFDYWEPTRIVPPVGRPITEFPYFTYLFADLHPHLMAYPMTVAVLALAVDAVASGPSWQRSGLLRAVLAALLLGAIAVTNPWDFPAYLATLGVGACVGAYVASRAVSPRMLAEVALSIGAVTVLTVILYLPFKHDYQTVFSSGVGLVRDITPQQLTNDNICGGPVQQCSSAIRDALQTPLHIYLEHFGFFAFILLTYLVLALAGRRGPFTRTRRFVTVGQFVWYYRAQFRSMLHAARVARRMRTDTPDGLDTSVATGFAIVCLGLIVFGDYLLAFLVLTLALIALVLQRDRHKLPVMELFTLALLIIPLLLSVGTQVFFVKDFLSNGAAFRMNTIFKFYNQVWVLYAVCSAVAVDRIFQHRRSTRTVSPAVGVLVSRDVDAREPRPVLASAPAAYAFATPAPYEPHRTGTLETDVPALVAGTGTVPPATGERRHDRNERRSRQPGRFAGKAWAAWVSALAILALASLIYPYAGTVSRETYRSTWLPEGSVPFTLDGMAFMKVAYPGEYRAITWLNTHVAGAQVIAEASNPWYDWRSRVSMFTGLPTIVNGMHENVEQRYPDELDPGILCSTASNPGLCASQSHPRSDDVSTLYSSTSTSEAWRIIHRYHVRYIYVGFSERQCATGQCFPHAGLNKFDRMVGHGLEKAYDREGVTIYRVLAP